MTLKLCLHSIPGQMTITDAFLNAASTDPCKYGISSMSTAGNI